MTRGGPGGDEGGGTHWELLPVVILVLTLAVTVVALPGTTRVGSTVLAVGLSAALGVLLGKIEVPGR